MAWPIGDSGKKLRESLKGFVISQLRTSAYASRLPFGVRISTQGEEQLPGIQVVIYSQPDAVEPWLYTPDSGPEAGKLVMDESHQVALMVKSDGLGVGGKPEVVSAAHQTLRLLFGAARIEGRPENAALMALGIFNLREAAEGFDIDTGDGADEGAFYKQRLNLTCSTDSYV